MLSKFSVKKPFTVVVAVIMVFILGAVSFMNMTTDLLPSIELPYVVVLLSSKIGPVLANNFPPQLLKNLFSVSEAPALIIKVQYLALMRQPVQQSCCEDSVAKKLRPAIKAFI